MMRVFTSGVTLLVLLFATPSWATTWFVDTMGSDSTGTGAAEKPWLTIQKCADTAAPGDICSVNSGTYTGLACPGVTCCATVTRPGITFKSTTPLGAKLNGDNNATEFGFVIDAGATNTTVQDFEIYGLFKAGVFIPNEANVAVTISGNLIHDIGQLCTDYKYGIDGIFVGDGTTGTIQGNWIHTVGRQFDGGSCSTMEVRGDHGIYVHGSTNLTIQRNVLYDVINGFPIHLFPNTSTNIHIYNNTFADTSPVTTGHIIVAAPIVGADIANNIFYQPSVVAINFAPQTGGSFSGTVLVRNNLTTSADYWGTLGSVIGTPDGVTFTDNTVSTDPLFDDAASRLFGLQAESPAIDAGFLVRGITFNGSAPDIGALETGDDNSPPSAPTGLTVE